MRVKVLTITPELIVSMLKLDGEHIVHGSYETRCISDPIPSSAEALQARIDQAGNVQILIVDESFPDTQPGKPAPAICPVFSIRQVKRQASAFDAVSGVN